MWFRALPNSHLAIKQPALNAMDTLSEIAWQAPSGKTSDSSKQRPGYPKKCREKALKQELCYIKFKLDIELNEVVNLTVNTGLTPEVVPLIN